jgi:hypothetical protein
MGEYSKLIVHDANEKVKIYRSTNYFFHQTIGYGLIGEEIKQSGK